VIFSGFWILHEDVEVFHRESGCHFHGVRAFRADEEALVDDVIVDYVAFKGEVMRKASSEEFDGKRKHFMTSSFGTGETLDHAWMIRLEKAKASIVFDGVMLEVDGEPI